MCVLFGQKPRTNTNLQISLGNERIPQVKSTKFLGMWIDESLSWNEHVTKVILKLKSRLNLVRMGKNFLSKHSLRVLYFAQIHSILTYGIVMWGSLASQADLNKLQRIQNTCVCIIDKPTNTSLKSSYQTTKILNVEETISLELAKLWHKYHLSMLEKRG